MDRMHRINRRNIAFRELAERTIRTSWNNKDVTTNTPFCSVVTGVDGAESFGSLVGRLSLTIATGCGVRNELVLRDIPVKSMRELGQALLDMAQKLETTAAAHPIPRD